MRQPIDKFYDSTFYSINTHMLYLIRNNAVIVGYGNGDGFSRFKYRKSDLTIHEVLQMVKEHKLINMRDHIKQYCANDARWPVRDRLVLLHRMIEAGYNSDQ